MPAQLSAQEIKHVIMEELPHILKTDPEVRWYVLNITQERYADRERTDDRFDRILDELKRDREENQKKWDEQQKASDKRWEENQKKLDEQQKASDKKWEENQQHTDEMLASIKSLERRQESSIGALGARWGLHSEAAFRNGLKAIVEESFGVTVERYQDFDYEGIVFGRPDQIELDVLISNGTIILCELKSSIGTAQMYAFWRKQQFYEKKHDRTVDRAIVISPMVENYARKVAGELGLEVYDYADEVPVTPKQ
jgi:hypothetical protein